MHLMVITVSTAKDEMGEVWTYVQSLGDGKKARNERMEFADGV